MRMITKNILVVVGMAGLLVLVEDRAQACTCDLPEANLTLKEQVNRARKESRAVFIGEVIEVIRKPENYFVTVKFRVENSWKGRVAKEITLSTGQGGGDCGYKFEVGGRYLVYAYGSDETSLATNICQRTGPAGAVTEEIKLLGKGKRLS
jgi:hypothetical protein